MGRPLTGAETAKKVMRRAKKEDSMFELKDRSDLLRKDCSTLEVKIK